MHLLSRECLNMVYKFIIIIVAFFLTTSFDAWSAELIQTPDLSRCSLLKDKAVYGKNFDGLIYLVQGKDGWLFRTKQDLRMDFKISPDALSLFSQFSEYLKKKGTELVIAHAPTRGMAASQMLPMSDPLVRDYDVNMARENYINFIESMNNANVHIVGTPLLKTGPRYFYKTDLHWTTEGAREMAQAVANYIKTMPIYSSLKKTEFVMSKSPDGEFKGNFTDAIEKICKVEMPLEIATQISIAPKESIDNKSSELLTDLPSSEIVLVGTSNSDRDDFDMNFSGSLREFLSVDLQNFAIAGGGLDDSILSYLTSDTFKYNPAKILIWEVPGYYNLHGDEAKRSLLQLIPATQGDCGTKAIMSQNVSNILSGKVTLFNTETLKKSAGKNVYLYLAFDKPIHKKFSVTYFKVDNKKQEIKFSNSKNPKNITFFYSFDTQTGPPLHSIVLNIPKDIQDRKITARLCPL